MHSEKQETNPVWRQLLHLRKLSPLLFWILSLLILFELLVCFVAPLFVPADVYLSLYLSDKAKASSQTFLAKNGILIPDENTGWKNAPNYAKNNWVTDEHGSRPTHSFTEEKQKPIRVLFLGNSLINGGTDVKNTENVSAFCEDDRIETLNFGVMLYSLDQTLIYYKENLYKYNSDLLVVGMSERPNKRLKAQYIPFIDRDEQNMPFYKPSFELKNDVLVLTDVGILKNLATIQKDSSVIESLKEKDSGYENFEIFCRLGLSPLLSIVHYAYKKVTSIKRRFQQTADDSLLLALMQELVLEAAKNNAKVLFLMFSSEECTTQAGMYRIAPDRIGNRMRNFISKGYNIFNMRETFQASAEPIHELYSDGSHLAVRGNQLLARELKKRILQLIQ